MADDETKVIENVAERLRFFFSDANLRRDKFMKKELESNDGAISIESLLKFNSIKQHTEDATVVAKAAKHESVADRIKLSEDEKSISRITPFDAEASGSNVNFAIRISNVPTEEADGQKKFTVTRDDIKALFSTYGPVALIDLHHYRAKGSSTAAGTAMVEFETEEAQQKAVADLVAAATADGEEDAKPANTLKLGENELSVKSLKAWIDERKSKSPGKDKKRKDEPEPVEFKPYELEWEKGRVISIKGVPEECDREKILAAIGSFFGENTEDVNEKLSAYVDYSRGQTDAAIRFKEGNDKIAELASKLNDGSVKVGEGNVASASILEGEEEETYYKNFIDFKNKQRRQQAEEKQNKRRRSR